MTTTGEPVRPAARPETDVPYAQHLERLEARLEAIDERISELARTIHDLRRREVLYELRSNPGRLLAGVADIRRVTPEDIDELTEVLGRWDVPLAPSDLKVLRETALIAQGVSGSRGAKVHLVVNIATEVSSADLDRVTRAARILSVRSRRAIPVLLCLTEPSQAVVAAALARGVEIAVDD